MNKRFLAAASIVLAFAVGGCSTALIEPTRQQVVRDAEKATGYREAMKTGEIRVEKGTDLPVVERVASSYLPVNKVPVSRQATKDPELLRQISINRSFNTVQNFAEAVTSLTGVPVVIAPDVMQVQSGQYGMTTPGVMPTAGVAGMAAGQMMGAGGLPALPYPQGVAPGVAGQSAYSGYAYQSPYAIQLTFSGTVSGLMDVAAARFGVSWEMSDGNIRMFRYVSKTFRLHALPGDTMLDAKIGNTSGGNSSSSSSGTGAVQTTSTSTGTSSQNTGVAFSGLSVWKSVEESVKSMLSQQGKVTVAASLGTVTVTDTPVVVSRIEKYIEDQNASLGKQVVVNVRVLSVDLDESKAYGIDWDSIYTNIKNGYSLAFKSATPAITGAGSLTVNVLSGTTPRPWDGTKAMIEALSTQGRVSNVTSASVTTMNNQPAPIQVGKQQTFVASSTTSITTGVATTSITPGVVTTGFSMTLVPHILQERRMLLQYAIDLSSLLSLDTVSSGTASIQTPSLSTRNFLQRVVVDSGDLVIVTGFENSELSANTQGVASAENPAFGGQVKGKTSKSIMIILLQPVLVG